MFDLADGASNATFSAMDGGLPFELTKALTISRRNSATVVNSASDRLNVKLISETGLFTGIFIHPNTLRKVTFNGAILQKQNLGTGCFLTGPLGGAVLIQPNP